MPPELVPRVQGYGRVRYLKLQVGGPSTLVGLVFPEQPELRKRKWMRVSATAFVLVAQKIV